MSDLIVVRLSEKSIQRQPGVPQRFEDVPIVLELSIENHDENIRDYNISVSVDDLKPEHPDWIQLSKKKIVGLYPWTYKEQDKTTEERVIVTIQPPLRELAIPAGRYIVRIIVSDDADSTEVTYGLNIPPIYEAILTPDQLKPSGEQEDIFDLQIHNAGNIDLIPIFEFESDEHPGDLDFSVAPENVVVPIGESRQVKIKVKTREVISGIEGIDHHFTVRVRPQAEAELSESFESWTANGTWYQKPSKPLEQVEEPEPKIEPAPTKKRNFRWMWILVGMLSSVCILFLVFPPWCDFKLFCQTPTPTQPPEPTRQVMVEEWCVYPENNPSEVFYGCSDQVYITQGQSIVVRWNVSQAESVEIESSDGTLLNNGQNSGQFIIFPDETISITLNARNENNLIQLSAKVNVLPGPSEPADDLSWRIITHQETLEDRSRNYRMSIAAPHFQTQNKSSEWLNNRVVAIVDDINYNFISSLPSEPDKNPFQLDISYEITSSNKFNLLEDNLESIDYNNLESVEAVYDAGNPVFSVIFEVFMSVGGAHPVIYHETLNLDLSTKRTLELSELFKNDADYLGIVERYCVQDLRSRGFSILYESNIRPNPENYRRWNVTPDGLLITFDPCFLTSCAMPFVQVLIPYSDIEDSLDAIGPLAALAN